MLKKLYIIISILIVTSCNSSPVSKAKPQPEWIAKLELGVQKISQDNKTKFGVLVKKLSDQSTFAYNADKSWYLSSTVKVPVAVAFLKLVDQKKVKLTDKVTIEKTDYRDGAGPTNWVKPGEKVTYKYLLDKMLIYSDNAATDLIIKKVGLSSVNDYVKKYVDGRKFGPITTLLDVRKLAYSNFHEKAKKLSNLDYFEIKKQKNHNKKLDLLAKLMKVKRDEFNSKNLDAGFNKYYAQDWNSAPLTSYAYFLELIISGKILSVQSTALLKETLIKVKTGKKRIRKGLPKNTYFAHKTGTQHRQACDMGFVGDKVSKKEKLLILVCTSDWQKLSQAEKIMSEVSKLISQELL